MSVVINGTGSISGLSNVGGVSSAQSGSVIQTVSAAFNTYVSITSTSLTDTGITATITPQFSTSKILVTISAHLGLALAASASSGGTINILRNSTAIYVADRIPYGRFGIASATANWRFDTNSSFVILDSPATTSSITYKLQGALLSTASSAEFLVNDYENSSTSTNGCTITLMEIAQ